MKLPKAEQAEVPSEKLRRYLLSNIHPVGRFKARFFRRLGYTPENWEVLADALRAQALTGEAEEVPSPYGRKFRILGELASPAGPGSEIVTIWILSPKQNVPRSVTAYPAE